ncbi:NAD(P)-binding protein [Pleomassaria siparia CBS 279.74]|uniref:NAD(P)-binding protein n=1 Tax=Pleomassaria siparia CBS 279.74 TaxID=1314801 RepID=A0A6G1KEL7_9PLEO|nr:NAD(P)-binding protein [Pleomassaria siparia CBS 279.74]
MVLTKHIERVAIVGANGNLGKHFTEELLKTGKHTITVLTRPGGKGKLPVGIKVAEVDYNDEASLVSALTGQQFLIITLSFMAPSDTHSKIVKAAAKASVPYIMPNVFGYNVLNESIRKDAPGGDAELRHILEVKGLGASYVTMACGSWFEWSVALCEESFGFDFANKKVTFYDDGKTITNISTWRHCGRALAALLSLPEDGASPALSQWKDKPLHIYSFAISQRDILDSINRVRGTTDADWVIGYENTAERYKKGMEEFKAGDIKGFTKALYARIFFPGRGYNLDDKTLLANDVLGLPKEDLDEATKRALEMVESGWNPFA